MIRTKERYEENVDVADKEDEWEDIEDDFEFDYDLLASSDSESD